MTTDEEHGEGGSISDALERIRDLRGRLGPPDRSGSEDRTESSPPEGSSARITGVVRNVGSEVSQDEKTQATVPDGEEEEAPEDWETRLDSRFKIFKKVVRSDVKSDMSEYRNRILLWVGTIMAGGLITIGITVWQMGNDWQEDIQQSLRDFRAEMRMHVERIEEAGSKREDQIESLQDQTDSLMREAPQ